MAESIGSPQRLIRRLELPLVVMFAWLCFIAIPLLQGQIGLSWDALNHHFYLGWVAHESRFDKDFWAAASQSYQFPYLYWPVYMLGKWGFSGSAAGVALASLQTLAVPPVWMLAKACMPGEEGFDAFMRVAGVALAFMTGMVLSLFDSTQNDLIAAIPLMWAMALTVRAIKTDSTEPSSLQNNMAWAVGISGALTGMAVAFKLSNGPLALLMPILWLATANGWLHRAKLVLLGCLTTVVAYLSLYGHWGWQLLVHYGNPIYPMYFSIFEAMGLRP